MPLLKLNSGWTYWNHTNVCVFVSQWFARQLWDSSAYTYINVITLWYTQLRNLTGFDTTCLSNKEYISGHRCQSIGYQHLKLNMHKYFAYIHTCIITKGITKEKNTEVVIDVTEQIWLHKCEIAMNCKNLLGICKKKYSC